mgnify:CR=1 FL=1
MKVQRVVLLTQEYAVLHLRPSWLERLFGGRDLVVELEYVDGAWLSKFTRTRLSHMNHSAIITAAMEGYPLEDVPFPVARTLKE